MVGPDPRRRSLCLGLGAGLALSAAGLRAEDVAELDWRDLVPEGQTFVPPAIQGLLPHDESATASLQPPSSGVRTDWNGRIIRMSGFIVPLDFSGAGVTDFLLVPYVGACIHVPPPPANQIVLVTAQQPYDSGGLFEAIIVTGTFSTVSMSTELADVGYALSAETITAFRA